MDSPTPEKQEPKDGIVTPRGKKALSAVLFGLGVSLLGTAVWVVVRQGEALTQAAEAAREAPWGLVVLCLVLPLLNWLATSAVLWVLMGRYGTVRPREMGALVGAAWLLNMLPLRPGMLGRVAYHKEFNGIRVRDSVRALFEALACTACALALLVAGVAAGARVGGIAGMLIFGIGPLILLGVGTAALRERGQAWRWPTAIGFRYVDMVTWAVRYMVVFAIIGHPIGLIGSGGVTVVSQVAMLVPVQLGLREWAVGIASTVLPGMNTPAPESKGGLIDAATPALIADGMMRASELLVVVPLGVGASFWLLRRLRGARIEGGGANGGRGARKAETASPNQ